MPYFRAKPARANHKRNTRKVEARKSAACAVYGFPGTSPVFAPAATISQANSSGCPPVPDFPSMAYTTVCTANECTRVPFPRLLTVLSPLARMTNHEPTASAITPDSSVPYLARSLRGHLGDLHHPPRRVLELEPGPGHTGSRPCRCLACRGSKRVKRISRQQVSEVVGGRCAEGRKERNGGRMTKVRGR